jgi:two-component sensor histidine kinase/CHASE3 domain sensor protein
MADEAAPRASHHDEFPEDPTANIVPGASPGTEVPIVRARLLAFLLVGFLALIAMAVFAVTLSARNRESFDLATGTEQLLAETRSALEFLEDAETGQRGFLLTEKEAYLGPYEIAVAKAPDQLDRLVRDTADLPSAAAARDLRADGLAKLAEMAKTLTLYREEGRSAAIGLVNSGEGKVLMDQVRADVATLRRAEAAQLTERIDRARRTGRILLLAQVGTVILVLVMATLTGISLASGIEAIRGAQAALMDANANLEGIVAARTHELRISRDRLAELLEQKTMLLSEVTHRVANSLQLIASLINIQAAKISDPKARDALLQARERVQAVMLVHRRLYTSDEVGLVRIDTYLEALAEELRAGVGAELGHKIDVEAEPLKIAPDKAVSLGVIVNELVTNALKYAFPAGEPGDVRIALGRDADERARLTIEDNGVGYSGNETPKGTGLGTLIIGAMAKTLRGVVERAPSEVGSRITLSFPLN